MSITSAAEATSICHTTSSEPETGRSIGTNGAETLGTATGVPAPSRHFRADKIFAHKDRLREWLRTGSAVPVTMEMDMTNVCNQKCPHCFGFYPERDQARMCLEEAKRIIREARILGVRGLTFTGGGDPMIHPDTPAAVAFAAEEGLDVGFITNAQKMTQAAADVISRYCVWVRVSLDAATPEVFFKTHGMGPKQWETVLNNVRLIVSCKARQGSRATVGVGFLTCEKTRADVRAFAKLGRELGVDYAQYRPLLSRHGEKEIDYSDESLISDMLAAQKEFQTDAYRVVCSEHKYRRIAQGRVGRTYGKCHGQFFATVVGADKKMYVCCHMRGVEKYEIGDLSKKTMSEIWNGEEHRRVAASVDFADCTQLCRADSFNNILWDLSEGKAALEDNPDEEEWEHRNFI